MQLQVNRLLIGLCVSVSSCLIGQAAIAEQIGANGQQSPIEISQSSSTRAYGSIEGTLSFPSDYIPALRVCAQSTRNYYLLNCINTAENQSTFRLTIGPGEYFVFSYEEDAFYDAGTGITQDAILYHARWEESNPIPVRVTAGRTVRGIALENYGICQAPVPKPAYCVTPPR